MSKIVARFLCRAGNLVVIPDGSSLLFVYFCQQINPNDQ